MEEDKDTKIKLNLKPGDTFHCDAFTSTTRDITKKTI
jgi:hypothetical protein